MEDDEQEDSRLRSAALQSANAILFAGQRAERELREAKEALERKTDELARSLAMMRATLESTTDGILVVDEAQGVTAFNEQFVTLWQMPRDVMDSRDRQRMLEVAVSQLQDPDAFLARTEAIYSTNPAESFDLVEFADGRVFERVSKFQQLEGRTVGRVWSYRDVTERKRAEEEIHRQREWFEVTLSSIGDAVVTTDTKGVVTFLNPVAALLTGWSLNDAVGHPLDDIFQIINERTRQPAFNPVSKVIADGVAVALANDTALIAKDGRETAIEDSAAPIKDRNGNIAGAVMVFHDVTDRRRSQNALQESHDQFSALLNQSPVGVYLVDAQLRVRHVNPKARPIFEGVGEIPGRDLEEILRVIWTGEVAAQLLGRFRHTLETGESFYSRGFSEMREDRQVQEYYDWELHRIGLPDGEQGVACYFIDISAHVLAQKAVGRSEEEIRALADSIPNLAWMADPDGFIFWYNRGWYDYTGTTFEAMQGWGWQSVHRPDMLPLVLERWRASILTGEVFEMEFPLRAADGGFRWFLTRVNPLRDEEGKVVRWFGTNTDVDEVRRAREALQEETRVLDLLNSTGQAIASKLDLDSLVQTVTDAGTELSGAQFGAFFYNVVNAQGEAMLLYALSGAPREAFEKFGMPRATPIFSPTFHGEGVVRSADITQDSRYGTMPPHHGMPKGHLPVRSYLAAPVVSRSGEVIGGLFFGHPETDVFTDRSERIIVGVAAQAAVAIDNARLYEAAQTEIAERKRAEEQLAAARDAAETANQTKDHFLAALSHELRTPLTPVLAILSSLRKDSTVSKELADDLETVRRNVEMEARLIDDLLDLTRITSGKLELNCKKVYIGPLLEDAISTCLPEIVAKRLKLERDLRGMEQMISIDPARIMQILWNLLKNAVKFTPPGGTITVRSRSAEENGVTRIIVSVSDTGIGIGPDRLQSVFEAFEQGGRQITRQFGGLGLGLAISQAIARSHLGTLSVASDGPGCGATFTLSLPLDACPDDDEITQPSVPDKATGTTPAGNADEIASRPLRILLVEDHADTAAVLARLLQRMGHEVMRAATVATALELAHREMRSAGIDLVMSDLGLPDGSGLALMRELSSCYGLRGIALSGYGMQTDIKLSLEAGFSKHLIKPVDIALVRATISELAQSPPGQGDIHPA